MITFIFRIAGESVKTVRAHCSRSAVCIRLCHPGTETGCIPLQSDDDDSIQTAAWQTAVSHCGIDGGRKKKRLRGRDRWNRTEMGVSVIADGARSVSQRKCRPAAGRFTALLRRIVGGGKKKMKNSGKCSNYFVLFLVAPAESCLDLSDVRTEWNELSH